MFCSLLAPYVSAPEQGTKKKTRLFILYFLAIIIDSGTLEELRITFMAVLAVLLNEQVSSHPNYQQSIEYIRSKIEEGNVEIEHDSRIEKEMIHI